MLAKGNSDDEKAKGLLNSGKKFDNEVLRQLKVENEMLNFEMETLRQQRDGAVAALTEANSSAVTDPSPSPSPTYPTSPTSLFSATESENPMDASSPDVVLARAEVEAVAPRGPGKGRGRKGVIGKGRRHFLQHQDER